MLRGAAGEQLRLCLGYSIRGLLTWPCWHSCGTCQGSCRVLQQQQPLSGCGDPVLQDSATLEWEAPHDCGAPISCYTLERDDGRGGEFSVAYCGPQRRVVVSKLQAGLTYRYRLRAENSVGGWPPAAEQAAAQAWGATASCCRCGTQLAMHPMAASCPCASRAVKLP